MSIARITGPGLAAIGVSVALLWSCVIVERGMVQRAVRERAQVVREIVRLQRKQRLEPVSLPSPRSPRRVRATAG